MKVWYHKKKGLDICLAIGLRNMTQKDKDWQMRRGRPVCRSEIWPAVTYDALARRRIPAPIVSIN